MPSSIPYSDVNCGAAFCRVPLQRIVDGLLDLLAKAAAPVLHMLQKTLTSTQAFDPKPRLPTSFRRTRSADLTA